MLTIVQDNPKLIVDLLLWTFALCSIGLMICRFMRSKLLNIKKNHENVLEELNRIKQFPVNNPNPIIHITLDGKVLFTNNAAITKYPDIEEKGFNHQILSGLDSLIGKALVEKDKSHVLKRELQFSGVFYDQNIATITWKGQKTLIVYCYDITKHKIFEKQLQITKDAADVANRAKGDFLANISHELRTPMNGIIGLSELLIEMDLSEDQKELADAVNRSSRNLLILLNDILDLSKIEAGELSLESIPYDLRRTVLQTVDLLRPIASRKSIILDSIISPIVPERIKGDPARLQQIMNNLTSNAIKFTEEGYVRVDVTSKRNENGDPILQIRVEDTGIGIPEDKRETVFHKFTQADVSTARKYGGTGLGLSITKELVRMMNGSISVDSKEGKGTTFYVDIPIEIADTAEELSEDGEKMQISINTDAKVLVVDDHPINLLFMRKVLKKLGFKNTDEASGGKEAIDLANNNKYDLIFMDCQMPDIDGFEASTVIRESEDKIGDIKIIAVTADAMKGAREKCLDSGMNDYISKPVDIEKLKNVLSIWLPDKNKKADKKEVIDNTENAKKEKFLNMDWDRLNMFTDGDPEEEKALVDMFIELADETIESIKMQIDDKHKDDWKKTAHKLKGSAANLGAEKLANRCHKAELNYEEVIENKEKMLKEIIFSYEMLKKELLSKVNAA